MLSVSKPAVRRSPLRLVTRTRVLGLSRDQGATNSEPAVAGGGSAHQTPRLRH
jgi:hypothetical protein